MSFSSFLLKQLRYFSQTIPNKIAIEELSSCVQHHQQETNSHRRIITYSQLLPLLISFGKKVLIPKIKEGEERREKEKREKEIITTESFNTEISSTTPNENNDITTTVVVALLIDDIFFLVIAELACAILNNNNNNNNTNITFLPLDSKDPENYLQKQMSLCEVVATVTQEEVEKFFVEHQNSNDNNNNNCWDVKNDDDGSNNNSSPLYYMFTSGSTTTKTNSSSSNNDKQNSIIASSSSSSSSSVPKCVIVDGTQLSTYLDAIYSSEFFSSQSSSSASSSSEQQQEQEHQRYILCLSSSTFDPSIGDIFLCATKGITLLTVTRMDMLLNTTEIVALSAEKACGSSSSVSSASLHIITSPALWKNVDVQKINFLKKMIFVALGGEAISLSMKKDWFQKVELFSIFGLTEGVVYQSLQKISQQQQQQQEEGESNENDNNNQKKKNFVGVPLQGIEFFLCCKEENGKEEEQEGTNKNNNNFIVGELVLSGKQIGRGLICSNILFQEKLFSGDLVKVPKTNLKLNLKKKEEEEQQRGGGGEKQMNLIPICFDSSSNNNNIVELIGRKDFQVKISGRRVNLEDVEVAVESALFFESCVDDDELMLKEEEKECQNNHPFSKYLFSIEKCVVLVVDSSSSENYNNNNKTLVAVVSPKIIRRKNNQENDNNTIISDSPQQVQFFEEILRTILNKFLRVRENVSDVCIFGNPNDDDDDDNSGNNIKSFPTTTNGKIDRKKVFEFYLKTKRRIQQQQQNSINASSSSSSEEKQQQQQTLNFSCFMKNNKKRFSPAYLYALFLDLKSLIKNSFQQSLCVADGVLEDESNFFLLGGDSLLAVKVSRDILFALFPDEADDRRVRFSSSSSSSAASAQNSNNKTELGIVKFLDENRKKKKKTSNLEEEEEKEEERNQSSSNSKTIGVDNFGIFLSSPVEPQMLFRNPTLKKFSYSVFQELLKIIDDVDDDDDDDNNTSEEVDESEGGDTKTVFSFEHETPKEQKHNEKSEFAQLLAAAIDENNLFAVHLLIRTCYQTFQVDPQTIGISSVYASNKYFSNFLGNGGNNKNKNSKNKNNNKIRVSFPLHHATQLGFLTLVKLLCLEFGCKPTDVNQSSHVTPLHISAQNTNSIEILKFFIEEAKAPIQVRDSRFQTLLHHAARTGSLIATKYLLREKSTTAINSSSLSSSSEAAAKKSSSTTSCSSLLATRDRWQRTPLHWAIVNNHIEVVRCLIQAEGEEEGIQQQNEKMMHSQQQQKQNIVVDDDEKQKNVVVVKDRSRNQLLRLTSHRTSLPYESLKELAKRLYGEDSEMFVLASKSNLN